MKINRKKSILIVEDDSMTRELIGEAIGTLNYYDLIVTAADGVEACIKMGNQEFDLILLDINMPRKNAMEVIKTAINSSNVHFDPNKVIILSGGIDKENLSYFMESGVKNYLVKPIDLIGLLNKVKSVGKIS